MVESSVISELMPELQETALDNGIRVVTLAQHVPVESDIIAVQVRMLAGSALDAELPGLSRFTSSMTTRGSSGRGVDEIADELDGLGAAIGVGAGRGWTDGSAKALLEVADEVVEQLAQALRSPDFPEDQVTTVRAQMLASLRQAESSTRSVAARQLTEALYPAGHPLHQRSGGTEESLAAIDRDALVKFHQRTYRPEGAIAVVTGGMSHQQAVDLIERHFGDWRGAPPEFTIEPVEAPAGVTRVEAELPGKTQADIAIGSPAINRSHPDYYALSIANLILGRFGLYGRLGERVREQQGMAYYAFSNFEGGKTVGVWRASAGVAPENIDPAIDSILDEVRQFNEGGPTAQEFDDAVGSVLGSLPLALETSSGQAATALDIVYNDLGYDYLSQIRPIIEALTIEQITAASREHIDPERVVVSVAKPA